MGECSDKSIWCVIPVYNNGATVRKIAEECLHYTRNVLVVDDGSTDVDVVGLFDHSLVHVLAFQENRGKGAALLSGLDYINQRDALWMIALDADGQHKPEDIPRFLPFLDEMPDSIVVGSRDFSGPNIPKGSRFGRKFSNMWVRLECGANLSDTQSGFRAYPVKLISKMNFRGVRYDFEVEVLTKAVWSGLKIKEVPVQVVYLPGKERVSHFNKFWDNLLLTHRHAMLISRKLMPWPHRQLVLRKRPNLWDMVVHPYRSFLALCKESSTPMELGLTTGVSILLATLPLIGCHTVAILYVTSRLKLNRLLAVNMQHLCAPPIVPLLCIQLGHFTMHGRWFGMDELRLIVDKLPHYILCWLLGSVLLAPCLALAAGLLVYYIALFFQHRRRKKA